MRFLCSSSSSPNQRLGLVLLSLLLLLTLSLVPVQANNVTSTDPSSSSSPALPVSSNSTSSACLVKKHVAHKLYGCSYPTGCDTEGIVSIGGQCFCPCSGGCANGNWYTCSSQKIQCSSDSCHSLTVSAGSTATVQINCPSSKRLHLAEVLFVATSSNFIMSPSVRLRAVLSNGQTVPSLSTPGDWTPASWYSLGPWPGYVEGSLNLKFTCRNDLYTCYIDYRMDYSCKPSPFSPSPSPPAPTPSFPTSPPSPAPAPGPGEGEEGDASVSYSTSSSYTIEILVGAVAGTLLLAILIFALIRRRKRLSYQSID